MINKYFIFKTKLIILVGVLLLSACKPTSQSVVFSNQCVAPCWRNINPGKTTFQDAVEIINKFPDLDPKNAGISDSWNIFSNFIGFYLLTGEHIRVYAVGNVVVLITFYNPQGITIANYINIVGNPEYVAQWSTMGSGIPIIPASETMHTWVSAINPQKGAVFSYDTYNLFGQNSNLSPSTTIAEISYFDIKSYDNLFKNAFLIRFDPVSGFSNEKLHVWVGYGNIDNLYPKY